MHKKQVRAKVVEKLKEISQTNYEERSQEILHNLILDSDWINSQTIALTISRFPEVDTKQIIEIAWQQNKIVVIPKCHPETREMTFHKFTNYDELETVYYGLLEPKQGQTRLISKDNIDLIVVPGLAYTNLGYRLGFGGGYYDRYLESYRGKTISLAFCEQIIGELPIESHDIQIQKIITDNGVIESGN